MPISDGLISFWELEEASGTRNDSHGTNHLTDNNTVTQTTGKVGNCAEFTVANQEYLSIADNASVSIGAGVSVTWVAWVYLIAGSGGVLGKWGGSQPEYTLFYTGTAFQFSVKNTTNTTQTDLFSTGSFSSTAWYFLVAQYDGTSLKLSLNNGTPDTVSYSGGINDSNGTFMVGSWFDNTTTWNGRLDQVGFWKRALTSGEITQLYNSGNGMTYAAILADGAGGDVTVALTGVATSAGTGSVAGPTATLISDLISYWELEEASGTRSDSHGTNHLTDVNTVTQTTGKVGNCSQHTYANQEYFTCADNASVSMGSGVHFTFALWLYPEPLVNATGILGKWNSGNGEYTLFYPSPGFQFSVRNAADTAQTDLTSSFGLSSNVWAFIVAQYDGTNLKISKDNGTPETVSHTGDVRDGAGTFMLGSWFDNTTNWSGRIDQVGFWKRALTSGEITTLYNSGNGLSYAALLASGGPPVLTGVAVNATAGIASRPGLPEEPRIYYDTAYVAPTGATILADVVGGLQNALNIANPGDIIMLTAGTTYTGNFSLPNKIGSTSYVHIQSTATLTTVGVRITPAQAAGFPKIATSNTGAAIQAAPGAGYYRFINCDIKSGSTAVNGYLVGLGTGSETSTADFPHHIIIDRCAVRGDPTNGGRRGVMLAGSYQAVIDSYVSDWKEVGSDTQAIAGWTGYGPYKIVNNYLEASGENFLIGGVDTGITDLTPSDIEIRNNHCFKPLSWRIGDPSHTGVPDWTVKNLFELKHCARVICTGNLLENNWIHAQSGQGVLFTVRNQSGGNPWAAVTDVTFTNNEFKNSSNGFNLMGQDFESGTPSSLCRRILISDNLCTGIGAYSGEGILFLISVGYEDIKIDHNTSIHTGAIISASVYQMPRFIFTNNITPHNVYGIIGAGHVPGNDSIDTFFPGSTITKNVMVDTTGSSSLYPAGNYFPATTGDVGFTNYPTDLSLTPSSAYHNQGTDGTDIGAILISTAPAFKAAFAASSNQIIV